MVTATGCRVDFGDDFSSLNEEGRLEIVDEMGVVADEETAVEVSGGDHVRDVIMKHGEINGSLVTIVRLTGGGLAQVTLDHKLLSVSDSF